MHHGRQLRRPRVRPAMSLHHQPKLRGGRDHEEAVHVRVWTKQACTHCYEDRRGEWSDEPIPLECQEVGWLLVVPLKVPSRSTDWLWKVHCSGVIHEDVQEP